MTANPLPSDPLALAQEIDATFHPGMFLLAEGVAFEWQAAVAEAIPWEIFQGRLLDGRQCSRFMSVLAWNFFTSDGSPKDREPLLAVEFDPRNREVHVVRGLLCFVWEGYEAGESVIESREVQRWTRELVGTLVLEDFLTLEAFQQELRSLVWHAVVGTSRLPLTSLEAPLPAFVYGKLHVRLEGTNSETALVGVREWIHQAWPARSGRLTRAKFLEFLLRATPAEHSLGTWRIFADTVGPDPRGREELVPLLSTLFNQISLSPWTSVVPNAVAWLNQSREEGWISTPVLLSFWAELLIKLAEHLTAYDLFTFHYRGANYPDALFLEILLHELERGALEHSELFLETNADGRRRRLALVQGWLTESRYEHHPVPDAPTSPGENARVIDPRGGRVPETQILQTLHRTRTLFPASSRLARLDHPSWQPILHAIGADAASADFFESLGTAVFIDRPLGYEKAPAEPDATPLLAHRTFSSAVAERRWQELRTRFAPYIPANHVEASPSFSCGLSQVRVADHPRPVASLADVRKVADDFRILRTLPGGFRSLVNQLDLDLAQPEIVMALTPGNATRILANVVDDHGERRLMIFDQQGEALLEMTLDLSAGYRKRHGVEMPRAGIWVDAVRVKDGSIMRVSPPILLPLRA